jgi:precorrin-6B methylase 1
VPGVSSVQVAFARLGLDWADARVLSAHGRMPEIEATELSRFDKIAILAGTGAALRWAAVAAGAMHGTHAAWLCENLTLADERIRPLTAEEIETDEAASLSIVLLIRKSLLT